MPAERQQADAVAAGEVALGERGGGAHALVQRVPRGAELGERVEQEHDRGVPLGMELVDDELAGAGARLPVDAA